MANRNCCICQFPIEKEDAPVIAMSGYGNPKCVCSNCEAIIETATESHDPDEITEACKKLGEVLTRGNTCDEQVIVNVNEIISAANERCVAIRDGEYDFSNDEENEDGEFDITDDLMETEEDRQQDEQDAKVSKLIDTIGSWAAGIIFAAFIIFFIIKFVL